MEPPALGARSTDLDLLARHRRGSADAFGALYARHRDALYHHARALVRDDALAEDLVHETFLRLVRAGDDRVPAAGSLGPFLHLALRRLAIDQLRSRTAARRLSAAWVRPAGSEVDPHQVADLNGALPRLPDEQLEVLLLHVYAGMTFEQVGEALEIPANTAMSRYRYALKRLSELLGEDE